MDRYYDKVNKNEWVPVLHGDPGPNPDVVVLPPENTFWGLPMEPDEMLTYDIDGLPLARVPRVKLAGEIIAHLLLDANLTQVTLRHAMLADSRGDPAPLVAFNAALNVLIAANPYTEAQFLEYV